MILSAQSIRRLNIIRPFSERGIQNGRSFGLSCAGYDIRIREKAILMPNQFFLASALEHFDIPNNLIAVLHDKSSLARLGLTVQNTVFEPGWRGWPTLELINHSRQRIRLAEGDPIAQVVFHMLDVPTERPYTGKYQDQPPHPVEAINEGQE